MLKKRRFSKNSLPMMRRKKRSKLPLLTSCSFALGRVAWLREAFNGGRWVLLYPHTSFCVYYGARFYRFELTSTQSSARPGWTGNQTLESSCVQPCFDHRLLPYDKSGCCCCSIHV